MEINPTAFGLDAPRALTLQGVPRNATVAELQAITGSIAGVNQGWVAILEQSADHRGKQ